MINWKHLIRGCWAKRIFGFRAAELAGFRGRVLHSYIARPILWRDGDPRFNGHSNRWESAQTARIISQLGYEVDAIDWDDDRFVPEREYEGVFDIHANLERVSSERTIKMLHLTGSDPCFANAAALARIEGVRARRGVVLTPQRSIPARQVSQVQRNLRIADYISLVGNEVTRSTYPKDIQPRIRLIPVTGSRLASVRKPESVDFKREFLWFGGWGAVHKGLDLVLEVFAKNPTLVLHVIGPYEKEKDFSRAYSAELHDLPNIKSHGYLDPSSRKFREVTRFVIAHVFPTCSESTSTAAVTCMQYGFLPILSINAGIDLTPEMGVLLQTCSLAEIDGAVQYVGSLPRHQLVRMIEASQNYALLMYSRANFIAAMKEHLSGALVK